MVHQREFYSSHTWNIKNPLSYKTSNITIVLLQRELYQIRQKNIPTPGKEIYLFPDAESILIDLANNPAYHIMSSSSTSPQTQFAIASRTHKRIWADSLLKQFQIRSDLTHHPNPTISLHDLFSHKQIVTGSKKHHFQQLQKSTGIPYGDMIFFDDDMHFNCFEVAQLGVLCCHCPRGITVDLFRGALMKFDQLKRSGDGQDDDAVWMGYTVTIHDLWEVGLDLPEKNDVDQLF